MRKNSRDRQTTARACRLAVVALAALLPLRAHAQMETAPHADLGVATPTVHREPTMTATLGPPTATLTPTPTASPSATATPTLERPSDPIALVIYGVVVNQAHPWLRSHVFPGFEPPLRRLYESTELEPIWVRDGKPTAQAGAMIAAFDSAEARGLSSQDYDVATLRDAAQRLTKASSPSDEEIGFFDTALSISTLRYVSDTYVGRIDPRSVDFPYDAPRRSFDPATVTREIADGAEPLARLAQLDPPFPQFASLRDALRRYRELAARTDLAPIPKLPKLKPGDTDPGIPVLRAHLAALGDLPAVAPAPSAEHVHRYDAALAEAVKHFQDRNGLAADAVIGAGTLQALQVPAADRVEQIELAMERMRWLPYEWPPRFIIVNIPEFRLRAYTANAGGPPLEMNVVVGEAAIERKHKTPVLMADMQYVVFRPYWMVPTSIIKKELRAEDRQRPGLPRAQRHGGAQRPHPPAAGAAQLARPGEVHLPQPAPRVPARHAVEGALRPRPPRLQPRLHPGGEPAGARRVRPVGDAGLGPGPHRQGHEERSGQPPRPPGRPDPGLRALRHRHGRRRGPGAFF